MLHFGKMQHPGTPQGTVKVRNLKKVRKLKGKKFESLDFKFNSNSFLQPRFSTFDADGTGVISLGDIVTASSGVSSARGAPDSSGVQSDLGEISDEEAEIQVTWADFVASMVDFKRYKMEQYLWEVFRHFDRSNNGAIDRNDLAVIFSGGADPS